MDTYSAPLDVLITVHNAELRPDLDAALASEKLEFKQVRSPSTRGIPPEIVSLLVPISSATSFAALCHLAGKLIERHKFDEFTFESENGKVCLSGRDASNPELIAEIMARLLGEADEAPTKKKKSLKKT